MPGRLARGRITAIPLEVITPMPHYGPLIEVACGSVEFWRDAQRTQASTRKADCLQVAANRSLTTAPRR
jgi:hypothetical protein